MGKIVIKEPVKSNISIQEIVLNFELFLIKILKLDSLEGKENKSRQSKEFYRIVNIMNEHIGDNVSLTEFAELSNMSVSNLTKIFSKYAGIGVIKYFTHSKILRSIELLEGGHTVAEVSEALDFSRQTYFSYVFRRETGKLPKSYKS